MENVYFVPKIFSALANAESGASSKCEPLPLEGKPVSLATVCHPMHQSVIKKRSGETVSYRQSMTPCNTMAGPISREDM